MNRHGLSLVEMVTVMAIIGILLAIGTLGFNRMSRKYGIEGEIRALYADLTELRLRAMYTKKPHAIVYERNAYATYSSVPPRGLILRRELTYPLIWNTESAVTTFDTQGLAFDNVSAVCIDVADNPGSVDSIYNTTAFIKTGKHHDSHCGTDIELR